MLSHSHGLLKDYPSLHFILSFIKGQRIRGLSKGVEKRKPWERDYAQ